LDLKLFPELQNKTVAKSWFSTKVSRKVTAMVRNFQKEISLIERFMY
jgi:hypothetical protein